MFRLIYYITLLSVYSASAQYGSLHLSLPRLKTKFKSPQFQDWDFADPFKLEYPEFATCNKPLRHVKNAHTECTNNICKITCLNGYKYASGEKTLTASCKNNIWSFHNSDIVDITECEPICEPPCKNNGLCIEPGKCKCSGNFQGTHCHERKILCASKPPIPKFAKVTCNTAACTILCAKGFGFPDGSSIINLKCIDGNWTPAKHHIEQIPDCEPTCRPPCKNNGTCTAHNICKCSENFRGPQCQYNMDRCSPKKMRFNGGYNCYGNSNSLSCQLYCPPNVQFEFAPATLYTCEFARGIFEPRNIPQCLYGENIAVFDTKAILEQTDQNIKRFKNDAPQKITNDDSMKTLLTKVLRNKKNNDTMSAADDSNAKFLYAERNQDLSLEGSSENCYLWNGDNVKTFDGLFYRTPIKCSHVLIKDRFEDAFMVVLKTCADISKFECPVSLQIYFQDNIYTVTNKDGYFELYTPEKKLPIPVQFMAMKVNYLAQLLKVELELFGLIILWDGKQFISVQVGSELWNRTLGLCGTFDINHSNDLLSKDGTVLTSAKSFADSWKHEDNSEGCLMEIADEYAKSTDCLSEVEDDASKLCSKIFNNDEFWQCFNGFNKLFLAELCIDDYCKCRSTDEPSSCVCETMNVFARECQQKRGLLRKGWRSDDICPIICENHKVYTPCGPTADISCGSAVTLGEPDECNEGCFCPEGTFQHRNICIPVEECPCRLRNKEFEPGSQVKKDCNICVCRNGLWNCTDLTCGSRCAAIGDPHYTTFDGKRYDFMGKCSYYLMKTDNLSVETENVPCPGSISEEMEFSPNAAPGMPSCTKSVTIKFMADQRKYKILLAQTHMVYINDKEIRHFPKILGNGISKIRQASSTMISVDFADGLRVWWDGMSRVYIDAPSSYRDKTQGLCGTFNSNTQDDFLTAEGDIETTLAAFVDKWRTTESCDYFNESDILSHPCHDNIHNKDKASEYCSKLVSSVFEDCQWSVDPTTFYEDCMFDLCSCKGEVGPCLCPILASYGAECNRNGIITNWRHHVKECAIQCPSGQIYDECGDSCLRTCEDVAFKDTCAGYCVEGCRCPPGQYLNSNKECVDEQQCDCFFDGLHFNAGYKEVRPGERFLELCTCVSGRWDCYIANPQDKEIYPPAIEMTQKCKQKQFAEFTKCLPTQMKTCKNMHEYVEKFEDDCKPGCICTDGYVLDALAHECVTPDSCSCHHGGKSYNDGDTFKEECNLCKCKSGKWKCVPQKCGATCTVWGDSHFTTFDKYIFDFQGACDYVLSKGNLPLGDGFSVTIQNVLCGTLGVTCSKSLRIYLTGKLSDSITLSSNADKSLKRNSSSVGPNGFSVYKSGMMTVVEVTGLELQVKWDHGTRVYVKLGTQWKGKTSGLCGNYNGDAHDDMVNPSHGLETSSLLFGHSWRLQEFCSVPVKLIDACAAHPERKTWAHKKCGVLKSKLFQECHSEVPADKFFERCVFDTCACDRGGDCECLCTSLAAYAFECTLKGVSIKWRSPELCPFQCPGSSSSYSSCLPACPPETCDNYLEYSGEKICTTDMCVEGCSIESCPEGYIYSNDSYVECVAKANCKPICMKTQRKIFYEGDITKADECHTCRCSRKKEICSGMPCSHLNQTTTSTEFPINKEEVHCTQGWTDWINVDTMPDNLEIKMNDVEPIPQGFIDTLSTFGHSTCSHKFMRKIECRVVNTHKSPRETDDNVYCSLEKGLICIGQCNDYEIRFYCDCVQSTTEAPEHTELSTVRSLCNTSVPNREIPDDCYKFLHCTQQPDGSWDYEEKTCGPSMMFNPFTKTCDWKMFVEEMKPICKSVISGIPTVSTDRLSAAYSTETPSINKCDPSVVYLEHPTDCTKFLQCSPQSGNTWSYIEKTCGSNMFNPNKVVCDWPANVLKIKPECGTLQQITEEPFYENEGNCSEGQKMAECAVPCGKACHYYEKQLLQKNLCRTYSDSCRPGCIDENLPVVCGDSEVWRDKKSCVNVSDCPCMSHSGKFVKPNDVYQESDCEICQCLDNYYVCSNSICIDQERVEVSITLPPVEAIEDYELDQHVQKPFILPTVSTPPIACKDEFVPVINGRELSPKAFLASSTLGPSFLPEYAILNARPTAKASGCWSPLLNDENQYLQVEFQKAIPLYGVIMQGSPLFDQYVTSFKILYSFDGGTFHYVVDELNEPQIFNGPVDPTTPIQSMFRIPIEAQIIRIHALTWHGGISMRIELLGCSQRKEPVFDSQNSTDRESLKSTQKPEKIIQDENFDPICDEALGIKDGKINAKQVSASSIKPNAKGQIPALVEQLKLNSLNGWQPTLNSPNEFIMIDFIERRNITGVNIQGGVSGWVTAFNIFYSSNGYIWNPYISTDGAIKLFLGNIDSKNSKKIFFKYPILTRYLKITPVKWENTIELKMEPLGCFIPYVEIEEKISPTTISPLLALKTCPICPNVDDALTFADGSPCKCEPPLFWNGKICTDRSQCPCVFGHIRYDVGALFQSEDCLQCVCVLGGVAQCKPQSCAPCPETQRHVKALNCACACEPCPEFQRLCPSSGDCIPETSWCNGIQDCTDDELNCTYQFEHVPSTIQKTDKLNLTKECPSPKCPPNTKMESKKSRRKWSPMFESSIKYLIEKELLEVQKSSTKSVRKTGLMKAKQKAAKKNFKLKNSEPRIMDIAVQDQCIEFTCVPIKSSLKLKNKTHTLCMESSCPPGYDIKKQSYFVNRTNDCPKYTCVPRPQKDVLCTVNGNSFKTFDELEYKYDICDHILARDASNRKWMITMTKNCSNAEPNCQKYVTVSANEVDLSLKLSSNMSVMVNGLLFSTWQLEHSAQFKSIFEISQPGNTIIVIFPNYGFWLSFDLTGNLKIGVSAKLSGIVDGLCGFYNENKDDDKRLPNGSPAKSTMDFGDAWQSKDASNKTCKPQTCARATQEKAWEMCNSIRDVMFTSCFDSYDYDRFISSCIEYTCECIELSAKDSDSENNKCKCMILENFVKDCLTINPDANLQNWRAIYNCEIICPKPFIHKDCYKRKCEPSCDNWRSDSCPVIPNMCFSGCYCPDGMLRNGATCIPATNCMDCECKSFGKSRFITYDKRNFTLEGNCTYLLTGAISPMDFRNFSVYITLGSCLIPNMKQLTKTKSKLTKIVVPITSSSCTTNVHISYEDKIISLKSREKQLEVEINEKPVVVPLQNDWVKMTTNYENDILISLNQLKIAFIVSGINMAFTIKLPSIKFGSRLEGLCGDCDGDPNNDLKINPKTSSKDLSNKDLEDIIESWQIVNHKFFHRREIICKPKVDQEDHCTPPPERDLCQALLNKDLFGKCHILVNPLEYISSCQQDMCKSNNDKTLLCPILSAYAKECFRLGVCIDWREQSVCPFECPAHLVYKSCECIKTCESWKIQDQIDMTIDLNKNETKTVCKEIQFESCSCPEGKVLTNDKCVPENQCVQCYDGHFSGDIWNVDKCTKCKCNSNGKIVCTKQECSIVEKICEEGYERLNISKTGDCCDKFICVPSPTVLFSAPCPQPLIPDCGEDQVKKSRTGANNCTTFYCECKPLSECAILEVPETLQAGEVLVNDTKGCCLKFKKICNKTQCPTKVFGCKNRFYEINEKQPKGSCCPEFVCEPPRNNCILYEKESPVLKQIGETWISESDLCVKYICTFDSTLLPVIKEEREKCDQSCGTGFEYLTDDGKCCGTCTQTKCILNGTAYNPGDMWQSDDNCTTFKCESINGGVLISASQETCPNELECAPVNQYNDGCCIRCKLEVHAKKNCVVSTWEEKETIGLIQIYDKQHGICENRAPIIGLTECQGVCPSGTKFNTTKYTQDPICNCCQPEKYKTISILLKCNDGYTDSKMVDVPASCSCDVCSKGPYHALKDTENSNIENQINPKKGLRTKTKTSVKAKFI